MVKNERMARKSQQELKVALRRSAGEIIFRLDGEAFRVWSKGLTKTAEEQDQLITKAIGVIEAAGEESVTQWVADKLTNGKDNIGMSSLVAQLDEEDLNLFNKDEEEEVNFASEDKREARKARKATV